MSLMQSRKRERDTFDQWNTLISQQDTNNTTNTNINRPNDINNPIILDSDYEDNDQEMQLSNTLSDTGDMQLSLNANTTNTTNTSDVITSSDLNNNNNENPFEIEIDTQLIIGYKKKRTNSLPQLPLSQISYKRVSEIDKIGEVEPNLILPISSANKKQKKQKASSVSSESCSSALHGSSRNRLFVDASSKNSDPKSARAHNYSYQPGTLSSSTQSLNGHSPGLAGAQGASGSASGGASGGASGSAATGPPKTLPKGAAKGPAKGARGARATHQPQAAGQDQHEPADRPTDDDGYYIATPGDYFANGRFKILSILGRGTFGRVIKALDLTNNETVAIKIIRAIPKYREASKIELRILKTLKNADPQNLNHCIHLREVFDYRNHICIMTDLLDMSLYEFLQKNKFKPFLGSQIQAITRQLLRSIAFLHDLKLIHTDLKPENILLTNSQSLRSGLRKKFRFLKNPLINVIDFGSAIFDDEHHSELVSTRHYRAPEIVLGIGWSFPCDLWSLGCILVELATGEALFKTHENLEHLALMQRVLDEPLPQPMVRRVKNSAFLHAHFKKNSKTNCYHLNFPSASTTDKSAKYVASIKRLDDLICSKSKLGFKIDMKKSLELNWFYYQNNTDGIDFETFAFWYYFIDLVKSLLRYDPHDRISPIEALNHPWWNFGILDEATSSL